MTVLESPISQPSPGPLAELRSAVNGQVLTPGDADFDAACMVWNLSYRHDPAVIVIPRSVHDVAHAVRFAARTGRSVTVQSTGHGIFLPAADSVLILMHQLVDVVIDGESSTATIGGGAKWERVLAAAQDAGLAPLLGSSPDVGAVGYTLGGGMGWLARKYGLNIDRVRAFELVTADGEIRRVTADGERDLFWALRGGGAGSLGVVTAMEIELVPVTTVYAGNLLYPAASAQRVARRYRRWIESAPDALTSSLAFMNYPPLDDVPDFLRGQSFTIIRGCFDGPEEEGQRLLSYWRDWEAPLFDLWGPMSFRDAGLISNEPVDPVMAMSTTEWLPDITPEVVEILSRRTFPSEGPPALVISEIRHAGGAIDRIGENAAYGNRNERHLLQLIGVSMDEAEQERLLAYGASLRQELAPHVTGAAYLNFLEGDEKIDRAVNGFEPDDWERLRKIKAAYDPRNLFSHGLPLA